MKNIDIDDIKVSSKLDSIIESAVNEGYDKLEKRKNRKFKKGLISAAALALVLMGGTYIFGGSVVASVKLAMFDIENYLKINKDIQDYKTIIGKAISNDGITIQLNEVILDGDDIIVSTTLKSENSLGELGINTCGHLYIDGKEASIGAGGSSRLIDEYTQEEVLVYHLNKELQDGDLNIELKYDNVNYNDKDIRGNWKFEFRANGDALKINTTIIKLDNTFVLENGQKIILNEYRSNDVGQKINYSIENKDKRNIYSLLLKGHDDLGNEVSFSNTHEEKNSGVLKDDANISENAKQLTLKLYAVPFPKESGKMSNDYKQVGEEFTIDLK